MQSPPGQGNPPLVIAESECDESAWLGRHNRFRRLSEYMRSKTTSGQMPGRRQVDPLEITDLLPYVMLIDVMDAQPTRFRFRLIGTAFVEALGREMTGQWLDEALHPDYAPQIAAMCERVATQRQPRHWRIHNPVTGRDYVHFECAFFPLSEDQINVNMLFVVHALANEVAAT